MNTRRGWFLVIGLMFILLLIGGASFLLLNHKTNIVGSASPTAMKAPVATPSPEASLPTPTANTEPPPPSQINPGPAPAYVYNAQGQLQCITYPDGSVYTYQYDPYGDKIRETTRIGKTWTYTYDQNHHPLSVINPEGRITHREAPASTSNPN